MTFKPEQIAALDAPLHSKTVKTRSQAGRTFDYIEAWHAIAEANRIFGYDNWTRETIDMRCVSERETTIGKGKTYEKPGWAVSYVAKVRVTVEGVLREGTGAGHGIDADLGQAHESAAKEAESDAMKRALMTFGNPFGLALYDKTKAHVSNAEPEPAKASAYSLKKNGEWDRFYEKLTGFESPDACSQFMHKARGAMAQWPQTWVESAEEEYLKHVNYLADQKAKVA